MYATPMAHSWKAFHKRSWGAGRMCIGGEVAYPGELCIRVRIRIPIEESYPCDVLDVFQRQLQKKVKYLRLVPRNCVVSPSPAYRHVTSLFCRVMTYMAPRNHYTHFPFLKLRRPLIVLILVAKFRSICAESRSLSLLSTHPSHASPPSRS